MTPNPDPKMKRVARALATAHDKETTHGALAAYNAGAGPAVIYWEHLALAAIEASGLLSLQRERDELRALIRECRLADAHAARTGEEGRFDRAFHALCGAERAALTHVENEGK